MSAQTLQAGALPLSLTPAGTVTAVSWRPPEPGAPAMLLVASDQGSAAVWAYQGGLNTWQKLVELGEGGDQVAPAVCWAPLTGRRIDTVAIGSGTTVSLWDVTATTAGVQVSAARFLCAPCLLERNSVIDQLHTRRQARGIAAPTMQSGLCCCFVAVAFSETYRSCHRRRLQPRWTSQSQCSKCSGTAWATGLLLQTHPAFSCGGQVLALQEPGPCCRASPRGLLTAASMLLRMTASK